MTRYYLCHDSDGHGVWVREDRGAYQPSVRHCSDGSTVRDEQEVPHAAE